MLITEKHDSSIGVRLDSVLVNVSAFGLWQMLLGTKRCQVKTSGTTLRDLIGALNELSAGKLVNEVLVAGGGLDAKFQIFVNGNIRNSLSTKLADGDEVLLVSVIDGG